MNRKCTMSKAQLSSSSTSEFEGMICCHTGKNGRSKHTNLPASNICTTTLTFSNFHVN